MAELTGGKWAQMGTVMAETANRIHEDKERTADKACKVQETV